ncbi:hypothetical protein pb186bvf_016374 [Paramecium bursaria]
MISQSIKITNQTSKQFYYIIIQQYLQVSKSDCIEQSQAFVAMIDKFYKFLQVFALFVHNNINTHDINNQQDVFVISIDSRRNQLINIIITMKSNHIQLSRFNNKYENSLEGHYQI